MGSTGPLVFSSYISGSLAESGLNVTSLQTFLRPTMEAFSPSSSRTLFMPCLCSSSALPCWKTCIQSEEAKERGWAELVSRVHVFFIVCTLGLKTFRETLLLILNIFKIKFAYSCCAIACSICTIWVLFCGLVTILFLSKVETNYRCCGLLELCFSVNRAHCQKNNFNISKVLGNFVIVCLLINLLETKSLYFCLI